MREYPLVTPRFEREPDNALNYQLHGLALLELALRETAPKQRQAFLQESEQALRQSLKLSQDRLPASHLHLGSVHEARGEPKLAVQEWEAFLKMNPNPANAASVRAKIARLSR